MMIYWLWYINISNLALLCPPGIDPWIYRICTDMERKPFGTPFARNSNESAM